MINRSQLHRTKKISNKTIYLGLATKAKDEIEIEIEIDNLVLSN